MNTSMNEKKQMNEKLSGSATAAMNELSEAELRVVSGGRVEVSIGITITIKK